MPKQPNTETESLTGWQQSAEFLGQPVSVAERWAHTAHILAQVAAWQGRRVYASKEELRQWLGRESAGEPVQIGNEEADLSAELKRGLSYVKKAKKRARP